MPTITALMIDAREPDWIKALKFGGLPTMVTMLDTGDIQAATDDGHTLIIERKTPDDFLNTLKDDRLFPQLARMVETRNAQIVASKPITSWPYLVIQEPITANHDGKVITSRGVTGWTWKALQGTLLSIQELGVPIVYANGQLDFEDCILRLGRRSRAPQMNIMPARVPNVFGPKAAIISAMPGIGTENMQKILDWAGNNVAHAWLGLTDLEIDSPISVATRRRIRETVGLAQGENLMITGTCIEPVKGEKGKDYV